MKMGNQYKLLCPVFSSEPSGISQFETITEAAYLKSWLLTNKQTNKQTSGFKLLGKHYEIIIHLYLPLDFWYLVHFLWSLHLKNYRMLELISDAVEAKSR